MYNVEYEELSRDGFGSFKIKFSGNEPRIRVYKGVSLTFILKLRKLLN